ncbi:MAG: hypothetical protein RIB58_04845 [Phycisphaerales bacterium]
MRMSQFGTIGVCAILTGAACADIEIEIGSFGLAAEESITYEIPVAAMGPRITGVRFKGVYTDLQPGGNWAADTRLNIWGPEDATVIGGAGDFTDPDWSFSGPQSDKTNIYADFLPNILDSRADGLWRLRFKNDYDGGDFIKWDDVTVTLVTRCPADFNGSGRVDFDDLNTLLANWDQPVEPGRDGDIDGDGVVTFNDLNELLTNWACE